MTKEEQQWWAHNLKCRFEGFHEMLNTMEQNLKKMDGKEAYEFIQPLNQIIPDMLLELIYRENQREVEADALLNSVLNPEVSDTTDDEQGTGPRPNT